MTVASVRLSDARRAAEENGEQAKADGAAASVVLAKLGKAAGMTLPEVIAAIKDNAEAWAARVAKVGRELGMIPATPKG